MSGSSQPGLQELNEQLVDDAPALGKDALDRKWPEAERKLAAAGEIVITRDSKPVARLLPYGPQRRTSRTRFDLAAHLRWLRGFWKGRAVGISTDALLKCDRSE